MERHSLIANLTLLWESDLVKDMGLNVEGYFADIEVEYDAEKVETFMRNADYTVDLETFFEAEYPDGCGYISNVLEQALNDIGNLPPNPHMACEYWGMPSRVVYRYSEWGEPEEEE